MADQTFASCCRKFKGLLLPGPAFPARRKERVPTSFRWGLEAIIRRGSFIALSVVALVCLGRPQAAAGQSPSVTIFVQTVGADSRITEHRDGDAIPVGARYRVQIGNLWVKGFKPRVSSSVFRYLCSNKRTPRLTEKAINKQCVSGGRCERVSGEQRFEIRR